MNGVRLGHGAPREKKNDSKAENAKEHFTGFLDILRVVLCPLKVCELDGINSQKTETKLCICYE